MKIFSDQRILEYYCKIRPFKLKTLSSGIVSFDDAGPKRAKVKKSAADEEEEEEPEPEPVAPVEEAKPEGIFGSNILIQIKRDLVVIGWILL